jgi:hypothetical protein
VQVDGLEKAGIEAGNEGASCGGFAGADFAGQQAGAAMINQELKASLNPKFLCGKDGILLSSQEMEQNSFSTYWQQSK